MSVINRALGQSAAKTELCLIRLHASLDFLAWPALSLTIFKLLNLQNLQVSERTNLDIPHLDV